MEFHRIIAKGLADNHRQCADGEAMIVERGVELPSVAHRHECGVSGEGSCDDNDFLYGFVDRSWSCGACFTDFVEDGFDRLRQFVTRLLSDREFLVQCVE